MSDVSSKVPTKRACDACKVRKVRCYVANESTASCAGCLAINTPCTFNTQQGVRRGPRKLREKTILQIAASQGQEEMEVAAGESAAAVERIPSVPPMESQSTRVRLSHGLYMDLPPLVATPSPPMSTLAPRQMHGDTSMPSSSATPIATLILHLCVYRLRLFPVWPIVSVEDLMAALQKDSKDMESYALANIIAAATIVQLRLDPLKNSAEIVTEKNMEREAHRVMMGRRKSTLNQLRIAFFLHVYHENLQAGGTQSLLYLREAVTMAQIMGLHREASYANMSLHEQQFQRRVVWQLFVTERIVAILHNLPVVLKLDISFPAMEYEEDVSILPAFRKLVNLYWILDKSVVFEMLQNPENCSSNLHSISHHEFSLLQTKLQEISVDPGVANDVQVVDISVTRAWICVIIWRIITSCGRTPETSNPRTSVEYPTEIARQLLDVVSDLPIAAFEAHGTFMELKLYCISSSLLDSISRLEINEGLDSWKIFDSRQILDKLQSISLSCSGDRTISVERTADRYAQFLPDRDQRLRSQREQIPDFSHPTRTLSDRQVQQAPNRSMGFPVSGPAREENLRPRFSQIDAEEQFMDFSWNSITEQSHLGFHGNMERSDSSTSLGAFMDDGINDEIQSTPVV